MISHCKKYVRNIWSSFNPTNLTNLEWINKCKMNFCIDFLLQFSKNKSSHNVRYNYFQNKLTPNQTKKGVVYLLLIENLICGLYILQKTIRLKTSMLKMSMMRVHDGSMVWNSTIGNFLLILTTWTVYKYGPEKTPYLDPFHTVSL